MPILINRKISIQYVMKTQRAFKHVTGNKAYAIWYRFNNIDNDPENIDAMFTTELNLELIIGDNGEVYASRSNLPYPYSLMFRQSGAWEFTEDADLLSETDLFRLRVICRNFAFN